MSVKRVTLTGAAGSIGYATIFRIASGQLLGPNQRIQLRLLELPGKPASVLGKGVFMELQDCAFPLLDSVVCTSNTDVAFDNTDYALLIGARPRKKGMERADLLRANAKIFKTQGTAIGRVASPDVKVVVVGNPANTNALICAHFACGPRGHADPNNISAMTRLDHNRGVAQLATRFQCRPDEVEKFAIWGNHSNTMLPDVTNCTVKGKRVTELVGPNDEWLNKTFLETVRKRGSAVIAARGSSSAASAGNAAINHIKDWALGTNGKWTSMGVLSDGSYGVAKGVYSSCPVTCENGKWNRVMGLDLSEKAKNAIKKSAAELVKERDIALKEVGF